MLSDHLTDAVGGAAATILNSVLTILVGLALIVILILLILIESAD